jgi:hypothetical protein
VSGTPDEREMAVRVARAFEALGIEYVLGGSVASSVQGDPRGRALDCRGNDPQRLDEEIRAASPTN